MTMASEICTVIQRDLSESSPSAEHEAGRIKQISAFVIRAVLNSLDEDSPIAASLSPQVSDVRQELIKEIFDLSAKHTWQALVEAADQREQARLLTIADRFFATSQNLLDSVYERRTTGVAAATDIRLRAATARALINGDAADDLAERANIRLASSYVVAMLENDPDDLPWQRQGWPALQRHEGVLTTMHSDENVALFPVSTPMSRPNAQLYAMQILQRLCNDRFPSPRVAVSSAQTREQITAATTETHSVLNVVRKLDYPAAVYQIEDVPIEVSLLRSPDIADLLATRILPLITTDTPLLETLYVYLEISQDRRQAAARLHVHMNTLDYRLRRIRELTGLSPFIPRDAQLLGGAVAAYRLRQPPQTDDV
jgi:hypothetical protein